VVKSSWNFNGNVLVEIIKLYTTASFGFTDVTKTKKLTTEYRINIGSITKEFMVAFNAITRTR
jgi:hypothetical protein